MHNLHDTLKPLKGGKYYSLPQLGKALGVKLERLPLSLRIVLESVLRNCDGKKVTEEHVKQLAAWQPNATRTEEIPFVLARLEALGENPGCGPDARWINDGGLHAA